MAKRSLLSERSSYYDSAKKTTSRNNDIWQGTFRLRSLPVLFGVAVTFFSSFIVLTPNGNFWIVPLLHSARNCHQLVRCDVSTQCLQMQAKAVPDKSLFLDRLTPSTEALRSFETLAKLFTS